MEFELKSLMILFFKNLSDFFAELKFELLSKKESVMILLELMLILLLSFSIRLLLMK